MRRLALSAFGLALGAGALSVAPAHATCMEHINKAGIRYYSCAAPGDTPHSYLCIDDVCREV